MWRVMEDWRGVWQHTCLRKWWWRRGRKAMTVHGMAEARVRAAHASGSRTAVRARSAMARWSDAAEDGEEEVVRRLRRQGNGG
jgi:hypothetical protein